MTEPADEMTKRYGKWMFAFVWIIIFVFFYLFFSVWDDKQYNPNQNLQYSNNGGSDEVVLIRNRAHAYIAPGYINGHAVTFMVDTGATTVALPSTLANKLGIAKGQEVLVETAGGRVPAHLARIDKLRIGSIELNNVRATITPSLADDMILLGMTALRQVSFRQEGDKLILKQN